MCLHACIHVCMLIICVCIVLRITQQAIGTLFHPTCRYGCLCPSASRHQPHSDEEAKQMSVEILQSLPTVAKHYQTGTTKAGKTYYTMSCMSIVCMWSTTRLQWWFSLWFWTRHAQQISSLNVSLVLSFTLPWLPWSSSPICAGILARRCREMLGGSTSTEAQGNSGPNSEESKQQNHLQAPVLGYITGSSGILHTKNAPMYELNPC